MIKKYISEYVYDERVDLDISDDDESEVNVEEERKLYIDKVDKSTSDLIRMINEGEINLQPSFQRSFVWDKKMSSRFIESLLLGIPIPTIFFSENDDSTYDVIDGQQRLTSIYQFMKSVNSENENKHLNDYLSQLDSLKITGLESLSHLNGMYFHNLPDNLARKLRNVSLPVVIVQRDSTEDIKFDIFSRINQGSVRLNNQELRNVMYRGVLIDEINTLVKRKDIIRVFGDRPVLQKRFGFQEIILRAIVIDKFINKNNWDLIQSSEIESYGGRMNSAIVKYLKKFKNNKTEALNASKLAIRAFQNVYDIFGKEAFKRIIIDNELPTFSTSINKTIAELQLVVLGKYDNRDIRDNSEQIKTSFIEFSMRNSAELFTRATNNTNNLKQRYLWGKEVDDIVKI